MIWTLKVTCVSGPYHDAECIRFIELDQEACLYDLHVAIQDAVHFDDESEFAYFQSASLKGKRVFIPEGVDPEDGVDTDIYEDMPLAEALPSAPRRKLFYLYDLDEEWVFEVHREPGEKEPSPHEFYPLVKEERGVGPDPLQYGNDLDDFVDAEEAVELRAAQRASRDSLEDAGDADDLEVRSMLGRFGDDDEDDDEDEDEDDFGGDNDDDDRW